MDDSQSLSHQTAPNTLEKLLNSFYLSENEFLDFHVCVWKYISRFEAILNEWIMLKNNIESNAPIFCLKPFGSTEFGIRSKDSAADLDIIVLGFMPFACSHEEFFHQSLIDYLNLEQHSDSGIIVDRMITSTRTPVLKMMFGNINVDAIYCRLPYNNTDLPRGIDSRFLLHDFDDKLLRKDDKSLQSINGLRDTEYLLNMFSHSTNLRSLFTLLIKLIKIWSKARGIYSSKSGYLGGFSWTVLIAYFLKTKQEELSIQPSVTILKNFFEFYVNYDWKLPVCVADQFLFNVNLNKEKNIMCILTCVPPFKNSADHASHSTKCIIIREFQRASDILTKLCDIGDSNNNNQVEQEKQESFWKLLVEPIEFFKLYSHYVRITAAAVTEEEFDILTGWLESVIVFFVYRAEKCTRNLLLHPHPSATKDSKNQNYPFSSFYFIGVDWRQKNIPLENINFSSAIHDLFHIFTKWEHKSPGMDLRAQMVPSQKGFDQRFELNKN